MRFRKVVAIDFDGVIHRHVAKWTKPHEINDGPVEGVFEFLDRVLEEFDVTVFSARAADARARYAIVDWLVRHWPRLAGWAQEEEAHTSSFVLWGRRPRHQGGLSGLAATVKITARKPHAFLYIDDRGWRFDGTTFPTMDELRAFAACDSWTKKERA